MGVFRLYGAVGSYAEVRPLRSKKATVTMDGRRTRMVTADAPSPTYTSLRALTTPTRRVRTTLSNSGIEQVVVVGRSLVLK